MGFFIGLDLSHELKQQRTSVKTFSLVSLRKCLETVQKIPRDDIMRPRVFPCLSTKCQVVFRKIHSCPRKNAAEKRSDLTVSNVVEDFLKPLETTEAEKGRRKREKKSNV